MHERVNRANRIRDMGISDAFRSTVVLSGLLMSVLLMVPSTARAAPHGFDRIPDRVISRLCDRQEALAGRLRIPFIRPEICNPTPEPDPKPVLTFTVAPLVILEGGTTTLSWSAQYANSCTGSGGWSGSKGTSGSLNVSPTTDTTYTLTCTGEGGEIQKSVFVEVNEHPTPTLIFTATPGSVAQGASSTLAWTSEHSTSCTATNAWSGAKALSGSQVVAPSATSTYALECVGPGGVVQKSVTINVVLPQPVPEAPQLTFQASSTNILLGSSTQITWTSTYATTCAASNGWAGSKALSGSQIVSPTATTTYALECVGAGGTTTASVTIFVGAHPTPVVVLSASPTSILAGGTTTLTWNAVHASSCTAFAGWSGSKPLSGSEIVAPTATTTYQLDCTGLGGVGSDDAVVAVTPTTTPVSGKLLITEVLYDLTNSTTSPQGSESANEWVELYNGTANALNLSNYLIGDASSTDALPDVVLPAGKYALITSSSTTAGFWSIPGDAVVVVLPTTIGQNGLGNTGDIVRLLDTASTTIDQVSYGINTTAFSPSVPDVPENSGQSIARIDRSVDTNTAADWQARATPTPGAN